MLTLILRFLQLPQPVLGPLYTILWGSASISDDEKRMVQDHGDCSTLHRAINSKDCTSSIRMYLRAVPDS